MKTRLVKVFSPLGLHARHSSAIARLAGTFRCKVSLAVRGRTADASSIIAVMLLAAGCGSTILLEASGPDEVEAIDALAGLISSRPAA